MFSEFRAPHHPAGEPSLYSATLTKQLCPEDPDLSRLGHSGALGKSCLRSPQIPPVPYNRSLSVFSTRTLSPESSPPEVHPYPQGSRPPKLRSPGFCPYSLQERNRNCDNGTHSPTHLCSEPPLSRALLAPAPLPLPPPSGPCPGPVPGPAAAPAAGARPLRTGGAHSAGPSSARAATASSPPPTLSRATGGDQLRGGGRQHPRGAAGTRGAGPAPSCPPATPTSSPGATARQGPRDRGGTARSVLHATPRGPPRAAVVGSARPGPVSPAPRVTRAPRGSEQ